MQKASTVLSLLSRSARFKTTSKRERELSCFVWLSETSPRDKTLNFASLLKRKAPRVNVQKGRTDNGRLNLVRLNAN